jgi:hypothetical protein
MFLVFRWYMIFTLIYQWYIIEIPVSAEKIQSVKKKKQDPEDKDLGKIEKENR